MTSTGKLKAYQVILLGGLVAGTLDITAAFISAWVQAGVTPVRVLRYIATGVLGPPAMRGGVGIAALGLFLHYVIATGATSAFYVASRKLKFLLEHTVLVGLLYGIVWYLFMNFVVLPLSLVPPRPATLSSRAIQASILMLFIGLPIAIIVKKFSK